ncbi:MAG TPA: hypothetical protein VF426_12265 [Marmoricola sp.]
MSIHIFRVKVQRFAGLAANTPACGCHASFHELGVHAPGCVARN